MTFESLGNMKFQTLEKEQLNCILGGAECATGKGTHSYGGNTYEHSADTRRGAGTKEDPYGHTYHTGANDKSDAEPCEAN